jgi:hypothetical protein
VSQNDEARREFEAAARELVEANKRARAAGQLVSEEMNAAVEGLNEAQEKLKRVEAAHPRHYEPVALTALVNAKIDQTFSPQDRDIAKELLINECGRNLPFKAEATPQSLEQIRLAVVKLANGNLDDLRRHVQTVKSDWRDVIVAAETPEFMRIGVVEYDRLDEQSRAALRARDHKQYLDWLKLK